MKKLIFTLTAIFTTITLTGQPNSVEGIWLTKEGQSQIKIFQKPNGKYYGKIVWLEEPYNDDGTPVLDKENPDEDKRDRKILGLTILKDFEYDEGDERWEDGSIYDPETGKTYKCRMWFDGNKDILKVKGYIGVSFIGRTTEWTRESSKRATR